MKYPRVGRQFCYVGIYKAEGEAFDIQAPFAGISYVVFGSWDLDKPLSSPT